MRVQVNDRCALSESVKEELYKCYPEARRAHLKSGGNFPYLSRADEVTLFLQVDTYFFLTAVRYSVSSLVTLPSLGRG